MIRNHRVTCLVFTLAFLFPLFVLPSSAGVLDVTQPPYNAAGDGLTDDRAAIQQAIDDASLSGGADTVFLPLGTYLLASRAPGRGADPDNARTALLWLPSAVTLEGVGAGSILRVGPDLNDCDPEALPRTGGFSVLEGVEGEEIEDVVLRNFAIDGNAGANPLPDPNIPGCDLEPTGEPPRNFNRSGRFVTIRRGRRILIEDCHFLNSNSRQIVHLGDNLDPPSIADVEVVNNIFTDHAQDTRQNDHSSIYVVATVNSQVRNLIEGNRFINQPGSQGSVVATALEIHGSFTRVEDNFVRDYRLGANVVASVTDSDGNVFFDNDFRAISAGFHLWSIPPFELTNTTIEANRVEQAFVKKGDHLIDWKVVFSPIRNLLIKDNTLTSGVVGVDPANRKGAGISVKGYTHDLSIVGNIISRTECEGIRIGGPAAVPEFLVGLVDPVADALSGTSWVDGVVIQGSRIRDSGSWGDASTGCSVGVSVLSFSTNGYRMREIEMTSTPTTFNRIRYVATGTNNPNALVGVRLRGRIEDSTFAGIEVLDDVVADFETPSSADFDEVVIDHHDLDNAASPAVQKIRACPNSSWKTATGALWIKPSTANCNSFSDWQLSLSGGL